MMHDELYLEENGDKMRRASVPPIRTWENRPSRSADRDSHPLG